mgnify:CR=1 FL=1
MNDKIELELSAIGENLEQYHRIARKDMIFWETVKPDFSPEDLVTDRILWLHDKLESGTKTLAVNAEHAQKRFTRYVQGKCRDLRKKKYKESTVDDIDSATVTVDAQTFDATIDLLEQAKGKLKPRDTARLARLLEGESRYDIMPCPNMRYNFRARVRKVYNAL